MGYGYSSEERKIKRQIWELNSKINENKQEQLKTEYNINKIQSQKYPKELKEFINLQLIPLNKTKKKLVEELQQLILDKLYLEKSLKRQSYFQKIQVIQNE